MITRRRFIKKSGLLAATVIVAPGVALKTLEHTADVPILYNDLTVLDQRRKLQSEILNGYPQWFAKQWDDEVFEAITKGKMVMIDESRIC